MLRALVERTEQAGGAPYAQAKRTLQQLQKVADVRNQLKGALSSSSIGELKAAIDMAEKWESSELVLGREIAACNEKISQLTSPRYKGISKKDLSPSVQKIYEGMRDQVWWSSLQDDARLTFPRHFQN